MSVLAQALALASPQGYIRIFADEGAPMGELRARLVAMQRAEQGLACRVSVACLARV